MTSISKLIVVLASVIIIVLLLFTFLINPVLGRLPDLNKQLAQKKSELALLGQQIQAFNNAQSDLSKASRKQEILNIFVDKENLVTAVKNIERDASLTETIETLKINEDKLKEKVKSPPVIANATGLTEIPYQLQITNSFAGVIDFLRYLEHLPQFTEITKIDLSPETEQSDNSKAPVRTGRAFGSINGVFFLKNYEAPAK
ncbi:MAG TPA: hypothetical protein VGQ87_02020 [Patescibacteria group bacterium]|nr:hypothetical protein [Patescibacteria group bacterium]